MSSEGTEEEEEEGGGRNAAGCSLLWLSDPSAPLLAKNIDAPPDSRMRGTMSAAAVAVWLGSGTYRPQLGLFGGDSVVAVCLRRLGIHAS